MKTDTLKIIVTHIFSVTIGIFSRSHRPQWECIQKLQSTIQTSKLELGRQKTFPHAKLKIYRSLACGNVHCCF